MKNLICLLLLLALMGAAEAQTTSRFRNIEPTAGNVYNNGSTGRPWGNLNTANATVANLTSTTSNTTNTITGGNIVSNSTVNGTIFYPSLGVNWGTAVAMASANITLTSANSTVTILSTMSGNHTWTLPDVATVAGRTFWLMNLSGTALGSTGNVTVAATAGNINRINTYTVTNTAGATGNVSAVWAYADATLGYVIGVIRR